MYSILLVEDEVVELETLKNFVDWNSCGITKVYSARGARSAMSIVAEYEPDIIITDIQMPKVSGIELARMIREEGYSCRIIFLTGYDKFEYARQAVQLHAEDFLLKPFQVDEVEELVTRIVQNIKKEKQDTQKGRMASGKIIEQMCLGLIDDMNLVCEMYFQKTPQNLNFQLIALYLSNYSMQADIEKMQGVIHCFRLDKITFVVLETYYSPVRFFTEIRERWPEYSFRGMISGTTVSAAELAIICHEMELRQDELFFATPGSLFKLSDLNLHRISDRRMNQMEQRGQILEAIITSNEPEAKRILVDIFQKLEGLNQKSYCQNIFRLYIYLREKTGFLEGIQLEDADILQAESATTLQEHMSRYVSDLIEKYCPKDKKQLSVFVKNYIDLHYGELCMVEQMAEVVDLSPNYLRKIFKDEVGITILEYLTDYRLEKARDFLRKTNDKVKDISLYVGYENVSYFTKIFTKRYGMTPNEYRKKVSS